MLMTRAMIITIIIVVTINTVVVNVQPYSNRQQGGGGRDCLPQYLTKQLAHGFVKSRGRRRRGSTGLEEERAKR